MPSPRKSAFARLRTKSRLGLSVVALGMLLAGCAETQLAVHGVKRLGGGQTQPVQVGSYKIGNPYEIAGQWYYPAVDYEYSETGIASWYGPKFHGKRTANGEVFDQYEISAAHRTLPLPSIVRVTNLENGKSLKVRINDRGPFAHGRIIDMSRRAAQLLGFEKKGTAKVMVEVIESESRQIAAIAQGKAAPAVTVAEQNTVSAAPRDVVETVRLDDGPITDSGQPTTSRIKLTPPSSEPSISSSPLEGTVEEAAVVNVAPVANSSIYVQAGAFSVYDNALNLRNRLYDLAPSKIEPIEVKGTTFYRVRLGPLNTVPEADILLERVIATGQNGAKVVVECADGGAAKSGC
ncbi:septal ring lytic transglycosylase RlpA family protein [Thalassospira sp. GO-4]|jgi:rare lipoprotein A|uniref:septal ring lytic transglycosylase RlpA family protein n=1 Tax=Thalassospira sp. GO-4 TaxID=2946605 RepID=UPI00202574FD|nr:septal ring lytic transglycosylase RlpA family protein [Thalassospira sp. GO-4]URK18705.1 septal ring lytic transglycosylase RlpA family protein [Thalassospira sp. GO-4]